MITEVTHFKAREDLAAAFALVDHFGWTDLTFHNLTMRVQREPARYLVNTIGSWYDAIRPEHLAEVDGSGEVVVKGEGRVDRQGFMLHGVIHAARPDAVCILHTHTNAGQAVACQEAGLLPLGLPSCLFYEDVGYHEFSGITPDFTLTEAARQRLVEDIGTKSTLILRNHGLLVCGRSVAEAFFLLYQLQRACEIQIAAQAGGSLHLVPHAVALQTQQAFFQRRHDFAVATFDRLVKKFVPWAGTNDLTRR